MSEVAEIEIPEFVQEYLEPISGEKPAGVDASNEEEYFKLNMEIPKTAPDYKKCIEYSDIILKEKSKDVKVAVWLCFSLFRTEKIKGLKDGLNLIYHLLSKYGNDLFPDNDQHRSKALQFLNTARFFKLVEREEINKSNANDIIEADKALTEIINECKKLFSENLPILKSIKETIEVHAEKAKGLVAPPKKDDNRFEERKESSPGVQSIQKQQTVSTFPVETKLSSEKDAIKNLRQSLLFFFEKEMDGVKKEQIPESSFVFGLSRQLQWGRLIKPPDTDKVTQIDAPNQIIQNKMKEWFSAKDWNTLIPRVEINFLKPDGEFPYWLDIQRYTCKALEEKGGIFLQASEEIKINLAALLKRIPELPHLKFKDKQTPFADSDTLKWLDEEVKSVLGGGGDGSIILPPILGENYEQINREYETAIKNLPNYFEENLKLMQTNILSDDRMKGKFLRKLNIANYCFAAKQYTLAKIKLKELSELISDYKLTEWEPALCTAVWQSLYLTNSKIIGDGEKEDLKSNIEKEQEELFSKIAKYDGILAIKLINNK